MTRLIGIRRGHVAGILLDLGVSSLQFDCARAAFPITRCPLDMRMDATQALSAWHVVNTYPQEPLAKVSPITARRTANALRV